MWICDNCGGELCYYENCHECGVCRECERVTAHLSGKQTSGPVCKQCGAFTTYARVNSHGMCMKCEIEAHK